MQQDMESVYLHFGYWIDSNKLAQSSHLPRTWGLTNLDMRNSLALPSNLSLDIITMSYRVRSCHLHLKEDFPKVFPCRLPLQCCQIRLAQTWPIHVRQPLPVTISSLGL